MESFICPVCSSDLALSSNQKSLNCHLGHSFDLAKQGYINLLLSHQKKSKNPGDTIEMVSARTAFLNNGHYQGIATFLKSLISEKVNKPISNYCDLACGEGYYTENIHQYLSNQNKINATGIDISSPAIKAACKRSRDIQWAIASTKNIPLRTASQHLVTGLFFHFDHQEISRILTTSGTFLFVRTGKNHLIELRKEVYDEIKSESDDSTPPPNSSLVLRDTQHFSDTVTLNSPEEIMQLLSMTPHYWRATLEKKTRLSKKTHLEVSIDIKVDIFDQTSNALTE